jgi:hypothetical protein
VSNASVAPLVQLFLTDGKTGAVVEAVHDAIGPV